MKGGIESTMLLITYCKYNIIMKLLYYFLFNELQAAGIDYYNINKTLQTNVLSSMIEHCSLTSSSSFYFSENNLLIMDNDSGLFAE